ncbi:MAG: hypothetical protein NC181_04135 [Clostridium sp.]|nr:hypothetical protein [Clostridium sp.]MCM1444464.1 hypothetical protein [Candidatus Amulumruptor caecigallinarius]
MNEVIQENGKNNGNKIKTVIIVLLVIVVLGLLAYIIFGKDKNKENENDITNDNTNDVVILDINSSEIQELTEFVRDYDDLNEDTHFPSTERLIAALDLNNTNRNDKMMELISDVFNPISTCFDPDNGCASKCLFIDDSYYCSYVEQKSMENKFREVFGPDVAYTNRTFISNRKCALANQYDPKTQKYWAYDQCGGGEPPIQYRELYKAEQKDDEIYTYWYFYEAFTEFGYDETHSYLSIIDANGVEHKIVIDYNIDDSEKEEFNKLKTIMDLKTYKITYKKQSDGKYYVYSGEWI